MKAKKAGTHFNMTTDSLIEKYYTVSIKFKIFISQLIAKIELLCELITKSGTASQDIFESDIIFLIKKY